MARLFKNTLMNLFMVLLLSAPLMAQKTDIMKEYEQIIPRGRIAAIMEPVYVPAEEAEIADDTWILGIVIGSEARAYSLKLLNSHEIVNDKIGDIAFAAVW